MRRWFRKRNETQSRTSYYLPKFFSKQVVLFSGAIDVARERRSRRQLITFVFQSRETMLSTTRPFLPAIRLSRLHFLIPHLLLLATLFNTRHVPGKARIWGGQTRGSIQGNETGDPRSKSLSRKFLSFAFPQTRALPHSFCPWESSLSSFNVCPKLKCDVDPILRFLLTTREFR